MNLKDIKKENIERNEYLKKIKERLFSTKKYTEFSLLDKEDQHDILRELTDLAVLFNSYPAKNSTDTKKLPFTQLNDDINSIKSFMTGPKTELIKHIEELYERRKEFANWNAVLSSSEFFCDKLYRKLYKQCNSSESELESQNKSLERIQDKYYHK